MPENTPEFIEQCASFTDLFDQLGLPSQPAQIADFIQRHRPVPGELLLADAPFWNAAQAEFIRERKRTDEPPFNILIDQLNESLRAV